MTNVTFEDYESKAKGRGFDEVLVRSWGPNAIVSDHTHAFSVEALVVDGEMWLTVGPETKHLYPGDTFELARDVTHAERYGPSGATYWAARRNA